MAVEEIGRQIVFASKQLSHIGTEMADGDEAAMLIRPAAIRVLFIFIILNIIAVVLTLVGKFITHTLIEEFLLQPFKFLIVASIVFRHLQKIYPFMLFGIYVVYPYRVFDGADVAIAFIAACTFVRFGTGTELPNFDASAPIYILRAPAVPSFNEIYQFFISVW